MAISVVCSCGRRCLAKDEWAGTRAKCPVCGRKVDIPRSGGVRDASTLIKPRVVNSCLNDEAAVAQSAQRNATAFNGQWALRVAWCPARSWARLVERYGRVRTSTVAVALVVFAGGAGLASVGVASGLITCPLPSWGIGKEHNASKAAP